MKNLLKKLKIINIVLIIFLLLCIYPPTVGITGAQRAKPALLVSKELKNDSVLQLIKKNDSLRKEIASVDSLLRVRCSIIIKQQKKLNLLTTKN